jgi:hypothetical protein
MNRRFNRDVMFKYRHTTIGKGNRADGGVTTLNLGFEIS